MSCFFVESPAFSEKMSCFYNNPSCNPSYGQQIRLYCLAFKSQCSRSCVVLLLVSANQRHIGNVALWSDPNVRCEHNVCILLNFIGARELFDSVLLHIFLRKLSSFSADLKLKNE
jgi:hypothetical protein